MALFIPGVPKPKSCNQCPAQSDGICKLFGYYVKNDEYANTSYCKISEWDDDKIHIDYDKLVIEISSKSDKNSLYRR